MKKFSKMLLSFLMVSVLLSLLILPASAFDFQVRDIGGGSLRAYLGGSIVTGFSRSVSYASGWTHTETVDDGKGKIKYGFETNYINEDYCSTYHSSQSHQAVVKNDNGEVASSAGAGVWTSTVFKRHSAKPIWKLLY